MENHAFEEPSRVILAVKTRLLREMLRRAIDRSPYVHIVGEVQDGTRLLSMVQRKEAQWVIMSLQSGGKLPEAAGMLLATQPSVSILGITPDGSRVKMGWNEPRDETIAEGSDGRPIELKWVEPREAVLEDLTLDELIGVLREKAPGKYRAQNGEFNSQVH